MEGNIKELRKLSRKELFEIILEQLNRINELENLLLKKEEKLNSRAIDIKKSGSIAEAALKLNEIFKVADKACADYLENASKNQAKLEKKLIRENKVLRKELLDKTKIECQRMIEKTDLECKKMMSDAEKKVMNTSKREVKKKKASTKKSR